MPFPLQLLRIVLGVGQQRGNVEHDFPVAESVVQRLGASLAELRVQTATVPVERKKVVSPECLSTVILNPPDWILKEPIKLCA